MLSLNNLTIYFTGHSGIRIQSSTQVIYIDPFKITSGPKADIILLTHEHYDHCDSSSIEKIKTDQTKVIGPDTIGTKVAGRISIAPGQSTAINGITIEAVSAYNINKEFHPKGGNRVGYIVSIDGAKIYHAGDTDLIPEMDKIKNIDLAFLPVSGTYVMTAEEAARAVQKIQPKIAVPIHWGAGVAGTDTDAKKFQELADKFCQIKVLTAE